MLLPYILFIIFFGGFLSWQCEKIHYNVPRWIALITINITLFLSIYIWLNTNNSLTYSNILCSWNEQYMCPWIPRFGINFHLALDGLSFSMIILTHILGILSILCSWNKNKYNNFSSGIFYLSILLILGSVVGTFLSIDLLLFFFFWEMTIIPVYFLIVLCGDKSSNINIRVSIAKKAFIYSQISGLLILVGIIGCVLSNYYITGILSFNYEKLFFTQYISKTYEYIFMLCFFIGCAIKIPIVPLHTWLSDAHKVTPNSGVVELSILILKISIYSIIRFCLPLFPHSSYEFSNVFLCIGIINIFYGSFMAFAQVNTKRFIAYSNISHIGLSLIAIYSFNKLAYQGIIIHIIANSLSSAGLFILCGLLYNRLQTNDIRQIGGLWNNLYFFPAAILFLSCATLGIPGTGNFIGEITILMGLFSCNYIIAIISTFSLIFTSIYSLMFIQRLCFGLKKNINNLNNYHSIREYYIIIFIIILLLYIGLFPNLIIKQSSDVMNNIYYWYSNEININNNY